MDLAGVEVTDKVCAAALSGWGLLATTVSRSFVATHMTRKHLRVLRELLDSSDMDVRMEAGENLALLHESRIILGLTGAGQERAGGEGRWTRGSEDGEEVQDDDEDDDEDAIDLTVLWDEVLEEVKGFITDSSKKVCTLYIWVGGGGGVSLAVQTLGYVLDIKRYCGVRLVCRFLHVCIKGRS